MNRYFFDYCDKFEKAICEVGTLGRDMLVPCTKQTNPNLRDLEFSLGNTIKCKELCVIDYYGYLKKSDGFHRKVSTSDNTVMLAYVVYFQAIKLEDLVTLDSTLISYFPEFKSALLKLRNF